MITVKEFLSLCYVVVCAYFIIKAKDFKEIELAVIGSILAVMLGYI